MDPKKLQAHIAGVEGILSQMKAMMGGSMPQAIEEDQNGKPEQSYNDPVDTGEEPGMKKDRRAMFMSVMKRKGM